MCNDPLLCSWLAYLPFTQDTQVRVPVWEVYNCLRPIFEVYTKKTGYEVGGGGARAVVASDSRGKAAADHAKETFGSIVGAAATGILQVW